MSALSLAFNTVLTNGIGFVMGRSFGPTSNEETRKWYADLKKAPGNPPNWLFPPSMCQFTLYASTNFV